MSVALEGPETNFRWHLAKAALGRFRNAGEVLAAAIGGTAIGIAGAFALTAMERAPESSGHAETPVELVRQNPAELARPMRFTLNADGVLLAQGSIEPGTAERLADELQANGGAIRVVSLNSPGGSLDEAIAMARQLRASGIATEVADGAICASSCPLLFAGGVERHAGERAAIGVHQFYTGPGAGLFRTPASQAVADAQITTARISRHLTDMGVDPAAWLHAMDTPPTTLYYFSSWELAEYRFTTSETLVSVPAVLGGLARLLGA